MRAVLTKVKSACVTIDGEVVGKIGQGFLILLGVGPNDTEKECRYLAEKALGLRIFEDENGKMNLGLDAVKGEVLVVSQFTLYADCKKGRRPNFLAAAGPTPSRMRKPGPILPTTSPSMVTEAYFTLVKTALISILSSPGAGDIPYI